jgi:hypothetical protein
MPSLPTILLVMSFPAGALGYAVAERILAAMPLPAYAQGFLILFAPLFAASLVMLPFLIPFFDRKAKADLAAHTRSEAATKGSDDPPSEEQG